MSVINKMLRDLDQQAASGAAAPAPREIMRGTLSVSGLAPAPAQGTARRPMALIAATFALAAAAIATAWFWPRAALGPVAQPAPSAELPSAPAPLAVVAAPVAPEPARILVSPPAALPNPVPAAAGGMVAAATSTPAVQPPVVPKLAELPPGLKPPGLPAASAARVEAAPASALRPAPPVAEPRTVAPSWQEAAQDALGQAQRLWANGARNGATDLLGEALALVERSHAADMVGSGATVVLTMLREQVRMDLAMGQPAAVLALLRRFERVAANQPDLWALRGNAAQNLGQHAEAALAYQNALRLRPGEPRWMLAVAVSLAAQGKTAAAAEFAEQARALTTVSPDVLAYLRQAGVPLR